MTVLKEVRGDTVQVLATDPTDLVEGQVWYNSTSQAFKATVYGSTGAWSSGGNLGTARSSLSGAGTQTAGLAFGGVSLSPSITYQASTEEYNGTSWAAGGAMSEARYGLGGAGTQTAGLGFGGVPGLFYAGYAVADTEEYDGSTWSAGGSLGTARYTSGGAGTQTAGLGFGGYTATTITGATEEYTSGNFGLITRTITIS